MRYGYWLPVFGGWLRNVADEDMETTWEYAQRAGAARRATGLRSDADRRAESQRHQGRGAPSLDAWSTAAALAAVTERLELMVAVRPTFHQPALLAKQAANIDRSAPGGCRSMSCRAGGRTRRRSTACISRSTTTAMRGPPSGSTWCMVLDASSASRYKRPVLLRRRHRAGAQAGAPAAPDALRGRRDRGGQEPDRGQCDAYLMHGDPPEASAEDRRHARAPREHWACRR